MSEAVHTIPVPNGWSPEQAWEAIRRGDPVRLGSLSWANVLTRDGRFVALVDPDKELA